MPGLLRIGGVLVGEKMTGVRGFNISKFLSKLTDHQATYAKNNKTAQQSLTTSINGSTVVLGKLFQITTADKNF